MRLIVLDEDFETLGAIPLFRTLIWIRRYQKLGAFELYTTKESVSYTHLTLPTKLEV